MFVQKAIRYWSWLHIDFMFFFKKGEQLPRHLVRDVMKKTIRRWHSATFAWNAIRRWYLVACAGKLFVAGPMRILEELRVSGLVGCCDLTSSPDGMPPINGLSLAT